MHRVAAQKITSLINERMCICICNNKNLITEFSYLFVLRNDLCKVHYIIIYIIHNVYVFMCVRKNDYIYTQYYMRVQKFYCVIILLKFYINM